MFSFHHVTVEKVNSVGLIIMSLSNSNSLGVYNINSTVIHFIKSSSFHIPEVLAHIINSCIDSG